MNSETPLEHKIKILEALLAQKPVEFRPKVGQHMFRRLDPDNTWFLHWDQFEFRLPPKIVKKRVPCIPADFPPGTVIRHKDWHDTTWTMLISTTSRVVRFYVPDAAVRELTYNSLMNSGFDRSVDGGKTWLPCYKEIEVMEE
jgi:hypothetical protein